MDAEVDTDLLATCAQVSVALMIVVGLELRVLASEARGRAAAAGYSFAVLLPTTGAGMALAAMHAKSASLQFVAYLLTLAALSGAFVTLINTVSTVRRR